MLKKHLFKKQCAHDFEIIEKSNAIQFDHMGYPLRLFICKCRKCGTYDQKWIDVPVDEANEIDSGKSFELKWTAYIRAQKQEGEE